MNQVVWKEEYSVGIKEIDLQHQHFFDLLNEAYLVFENPKSEENIKDLIIRINDYALLHFSTEERYFNEFKYEYTNEHKKAHDTLISDLEVLILNFEKKGIAVVPELVDFLDSWLLEHIAVFDRKYIPCFKEHGL